MYIGCILVRATTKKQKSAKQNEVIQTSSFLTISHRNTLPLPVYIRVYEKKEKKYIYIYM